MSKEIAALANSPIGFAGSHGMGSPLSVFAGTSVWVLTMSRSPSSVLLPFFWGGFPLLKQTTENRNRVPLIYPLYWTEMWRWILRMSLSREPASGAAGGPQLLGAGPVQDGPGLRHSLRLARGLLRPEARREGRPSGSPFGSRITSFKLWCLFVAVCCRSNLGRRGDFLSCSRGSMGRRACHVSGRKLLS